MQPCYFRNYMNATVQTKFDNSDLGTIKMLVSNRLSNQAMELAYTSQEDGIKMINHTIQDLFNVFILDHWTNEDLISEIVEHIEAQADFQKRVSN